MKGIRQRVRIAMLLFGVMLIVVACKKKDDSLCSVGDQKLYQEDVIAFGMVYSQEHGVGNRAYLQEEYDENMTYEEYYTQQLREEIQDVLILYNEAKKNGIELTKEQKEAVSENTKALVDAYGKQWMEEKHIKSSKIENVYKMKQLAQQYMEQTLLDNQGGLESQKDERYIRVCQITFPTVKIDEDGMICTTKDGKLEQVSQEQMEQIKQDAEDFAGFAANKSGLKNALEEYEEIEEQIVERNLKYEDLTKEFREEVDRMHVGDTSKAVATQYGYCVFELLEADDAEYVQSLVQYQEKEVLNQKKTDWLEELRREYIKQDMVTMNNSYWESVRFLDFVR